MAPNLAETKPEETSGPPDRSRRIYVYWAVALAFLAALGLFCWLVAGPVLEARSAAEELSRSSGHEMLPSPERTAPLIARLGGPEQAVRKLGLFLRLPKWAGGGNESNRWVAVALLGYCGKPALPTLGALLDSREDETQLLAAMGMTIHCLNRKRPSPPPPASTLPVPWANVAEEDLPILDFSRVLEFATKDEDPQVRDVAAKALKVWKAKLAAMPPRPY